MGQLKLGLAPGAGRWFHGGVQESFSDAALVLIGHGSTLNADSAAPTRQHADEFRRRGSFAQVQEAFWKQEPYLWQVGRGIFAPRVFFVPLFISEGYFTEEVIPRELGLLAPGQQRLAAFPVAAKRGGQRLFYCGPVGTHDSMTAVLRARAGEVVGNETAPPPPDQTTLFIAGHGTGNNENSRQAIERQVELLRGQGLYADVQPCFMEEDPRVAGCAETAKTSNVIVVPFFISDGLHSFEDIPVMLGESPQVVQERMRAGVPTWKNPTELNGKRIWYSSSVGREPGLAEVILQRVREASLVCSG